MAIQQKALYITAKQGPLAVGDVDIPTPGSGEVLVKVEVAALNPGDWAIWKFGMLKVAFPAILGFEGAGTVEAIGEGVTSLAQGDRVYARSVYETTICADDKRG